MAFPSEEEKQVKQKPTCTRLKNAKSILLLWYFRKAVRSRLPCDGDGEGDGDRERERERESQPSEASTTRTLSDLESQLRDLYRKRVTSRTSTQEWNSTRLQLNTCS